MYVRTYVRTYVCDLMYNTYTHTHTFPILCFQSARGTLHGNHRGQLVFFIDVLSGGVRWGFGIQETLHFPITSQSKSI